jgi:hypothetical protein
MVVKAAVVGAVAAFGFPQLCVVVVGWWVGHKVAASSVVELLSVC